jgi:cobalt-zinc-cadmium efflux system outer membrane protein
MTLLSPSHSRHSTADIRTRPGWHAALALAAAAFLAGCTNLPADHGRSGVDALLVDYRAAGTLPAQLAEAAQETTELEAPLTLSRALQIALMRNPNLQAEFASLGFAAAEVYQAGRLSNPQLGFSYLFTSGSGQDERTLSITQRFTELLMLSASRRRAVMAFTRTQHAVAGAVELLAAEVAHAWFDLAGATELATIADELAEVARISASLAERFFAAGNLNRRQLAERQAAAASARLEALSAAEQVLAAQAHLQRLLGGGITTDLPVTTGGLPAPEQALPTLAALLTEADRARLDLLAARQQVAISADTLEVTRQFRYLGDLALGPKVEWDDDGYRHTGGALSVELPLFDRGHGRLARAEAGLALAEARLSALESDIGAALIHAVHATAHARARFELHESELIPARREIVARRQEEVNFMLEGPFVLLAAKQQEFEAYRGSLAALKDYWLARVAMARAAGAPPPVPAENATLHSAAAYVEVTAAESSYDPHVHGQGRDAHPHGHDQHPAPAGEDAAEPQHRQHDHHQQQHHHQPHRHHHHHGDHQ